MNNKMNKLAAAIMVACASTAQADDVVVEPDSGDGLVVTNAGATEERFRVNEDGTIFIPPLTSAPQQTDPVCSDSVSGELGTCAVGTFIGPAGPTGPQGVAGPTGPTGAQGPTGPTGAQGPTGPIGPTGALGPTGPTGVQGPTGPTGSQGPTGPTGAQGPTGPTGSQGLTGPTGAQGPTGPIGAQGPTGPIGPVGPIGATGATGMQGIPGPSGPTGATGATGMQGIPGPGGPIGPTGPAGPAGAGGATDVYGNASNTTTTITNANWATTREPNPNFGNLTINGNLVVPSGQVIQCTGTLTINGSITVNPGMPGSGEAGPDQFGAGTLPVLGTTGTPGLTPVAASNFLIPGSFAATNGEGEDGILSGAGAGSLVILCQNGIVFGPSGKIFANGGNAQDYTTVTSSNTRGGSGGGGGGFIVIASQGNVTIPTANSIEVSGGDGGDAFQGNDNNGMPVDEAGGGGGGGGIVHFLSPNANSIPANRVALAGGTAGANGPAPVPDGAGSNGGGGMGGSGGNGGDGTTTSAGNGGAGFILRTQVTNPEFLFIAR
ncbi:MAG: hypothetical protein AAGJ52_06670 [Pseudomonadota bacterium]